MLTACWSVKGGSGTTVLAASVALATARGGQRVVIADLAGDVPATLGVADPAGPGLGDWLDAGPSVPEDALARLIVDATGGVSLVGRGGAPRSPAWDTVESGERLATALAALAGAGEVVVDCGRADSAASAAVVERSDRSILVLRPCYLALRRALAAPRATGVVVITEPDRALSVPDIEEVLGVPVIAEIPWDPAIARAIDAGLMGTRLPRRLMNALRTVAA